MEVLRNVVGVAHSEEEGPPGSSCLQRAYKQLSERVDKQYGGFGSAPKFPQPGIYSHVYVHRKIFEVSSFLNVYTCTCPY